MNRWYRKTVTKAVVVIVGIVSGAVLTASLLASIALAGTLNPKDIHKILSQKYEESEDFNQAVEDSVYEVLDRIRLEQMFETDGAYNPNKIVDVAEYSRNMRISGNNGSGVAYTLDELKSWSDDFGSDEGQLYDKNAVIVCQKNDESFYYYYLDDFLELFERGGLKMEFDDSMTQQQYLESLKTGDMTSSGSYGMHILDSEGKELYVDCWNFGQSLKERYAPQGADNLLEIVNNSPELNGKLSSIYEDIASTLYNLYADMQTYEKGWEYLDEGNTNLTYIYANQKTKKIVTNKEAYRDYSDLGENIRQMKSSDSVRYMIVYPKLKDFQTNMNISESNEWDMFRSYETDRRLDSVMAVAVDTTYPISDKFYEGNFSYGENVPLLRASLRSIYIFGMLLLISIVWTAMTAGRKVDDNQIHVTTFDRCKTELAAIIIIGIWFCVSVLLSRLLAQAGYTPGTGIGQGYYDEPSVMGMDMSAYSSLTGASIRFMDIALIFLYSLFCFTCFFAAYVSLLRRIKARILWKGSLLHSLILLANEVIRERAVTVGAAAFLAVYLICQWMAVFWQSLSTWMLALALNIAAVWLVLSRAAAKNRIKKGIEEIESGNMSYQICVDGIRGADRELAEKVNDIGSGLTKAVEEAMRNERLKTDLITNVSHDIKTPLTSIINYVDLLKRENIQNERIRGYLDILESKAQRLKTLTEDVVEASKVSSGNISLELMDVNFTEMIQQTEGEFSEKFAQKDLMAVLSIPEEPAVIHVDGRRMWRVLENIFSNVVKYAMPGTRVYADLQIEEETVRFSLKNVSEQQLNISADELTERFIRGDISRSTEGSGLGLSIAKSLTVMQGGKFELYLDGDLFKVDISFPRVKKQ